MRTKSTFLERKAMASPTLLQGSPVAKVRGCQNLSIAAISAQQAGHRVDVGLELCLAGDRRGRRGRRYRDSGSVQSGFCDGPTKGRSSSDVCARAIAEP